MTRTVEPGEWARTGRGVWVAKTDDTMSFKMVVRMGDGGAIYAGVQEDDGQVVSSHHSFGGFASPKDARAWCDKQWERLYSRPARVGRLKRKIAELQRELAAEMEVPA